MNAVFYLTILPYYDTGFSPSASVITGLLFCGAMGLLTFFILSFYFVNNKNKSYLFYGLFVLFSLLGGLINLRYDFLLMGGGREMDVTASLLLEIVTLLAFSSYCWFTIELLDIKQQNKRLYKWIRIMAYFAILYLLYYTLFYRITSTYEGIYFLFSRIVIISMSVSAIIWVIVKIKSRVKGMFIIGSSAYFLGALLSSIVQLDSNLPFEWLYSLRSTIYFEAGILLESFCFGLALSYRVYLSHKIKQREEEHLRIQAEYEKSLAQAEMLATRMQVNPHFIFNCLGAINLLIQKKENQKASQYLVTFSRFIRMILELPKSNTIPLKEELKLIKYYIALEEKRFDNNFIFQIETTDDCMAEQLHIPPLLLQPFVENAIWHGLLPSPYQKKKLLIKISKNDSGATIVIEDNGVGRREEDSSILQHEKKKSLGMKITGKRIAQFNQSFNCEIDLTLSDKNKRPKAGEGKGTRVVLSIPEIQFGREDNAM